MVASRVDTENMRLCAKNKLDCICTSASATSIRMQPQTALCKLTVVTRGHEKLTQSNPSRWAQIKGSVEFTARPLHRSHCSPPATAGKKTGLFQARINREPLSLFCLSAANRFCKFYATALAATFERPAGCCPRRRWHALHFWIVENGNFIRNPQKSIHSYPAGQEFWIEAE